MMEDMQINQDGQLRCELGLGKTFTYLCTIVPSEEVKELIRFECVIMVEVKSGTLININGIARKKNKSRFYARFLKLLSERETYNQVM